MVRVIFTIKNLICGAAAAAGTRHTGRELNSMHENSPVHIQMLLQYKPLMMAE